MRVVVEIIAGARAGRRYEFASPRLIRLGRHPDSDVPFDPVADRDASTRHAEIVADADGYTLFDRGSANGTRLGGREPPLQHHLLRDGDEIEFGRGGPRCRVHLDGRGLAAAPSRPVGSETVSVMIQRALGEARQAGGGRVSPTLVMRALARASAGHRTLRALVVLLALLLAASLVTLVVVWRRSPPSEASLRRELVARLDELRRADSAALRGRIEELNQELSRARSAQGGSAVARAARDVVYLVAVGAASGEEGFCTAFAVARRSLATNAHCVVLAESLRRRGQKVFVVKNGAPALRLGLVSSRRSPRYAGPTRLSEDVGLIEVDADLPQLAELADGAALRRIQPGDVIFTYGFPGRLADVAAPEATFVQGVVGRLTRLDGERGGTAEEVLVQHSAFTAGGTSGSPIFDGAGRVIAVNAGGYVEEDPVALRDPRSGRSSRLLVTQPLHGYNYGLRIDLVQRLMNEASE